MVPIMTDIACDDPHRVQLAREVHDIGGGDPPRALTEGSRDEKWVSDLEVGGIPNGVRKLACQKRTFDSIQPITLGLKWHDEDVDRVSCKHVRIERAL